MGKITLDFNSLDHYYEDSKEVFSEDFLKEQVTDCCKPCQELDYCPYGILVEQSPLPPIPRKDAVKHIDYLNSLIQKDSYPDGQKLNYSQSILLP